MKLYFWLKGDLMPTLGSGQTAADAIDNLYQTVLRRDADPFGLSVFESIFNAGVSLDIIRDALVTSSEATSFVDPILRLYEVAFGRQADDAGLTAFVNAYRDGASLESIALGFTGSQEFINRFGVSTDRSAFVESLYINGLGRASDEVGKAGWVNSSLTDVQMLLGFSESGESIARLDSNATTFLTNLSEGIAADTSASLTDVAEPTVTEGDFSATTGGALIVGDTGIGSFAATAGDTFTSAIAGNASTGNGTIAVSGSDSLEIGSEGFIVGNAGTGTLTVSNSGAVFVSGDDSFFSVGQLTDSSGVLNILSGGSLTVSGGLDGVELVIGDDAGATGDVTVSGAGSTIDIGNGFGGLIVGNAGTGSLRIDDGGSVTAGGLFTGNQASGIGSVIVSGAGSTLTADQQFLVGGVGSGTLTIEAGGVVTSASPALQIGAHEGSTGAVTVTGAGSRLDATGFLLVGRGGDEFGTPGASTTGSLDILVGGAVNATDSLQIGGEINATGSVTVDGAASTLDVTGLFQIGNLGVGTLTISNGGAVNQISTESRGSGIDVGLRAGAVGTLDILSGGSLTLSGPNDTVELFIGNDEGATGTVTVSGEGSTLTMTGSTATIFVGSQGTGTLTVSNGGVVTAANIIIGILGTLNDTGGTIVGNVSVAGLVGPGASVGTLTVDGNFTLNGGTLDIEIGAGGNTDQLIVSNLLDVQDGIVALSFLDGFLPNAGETFQFATGGSVLLDTASVSLVVSGVSAAGISAPTIVVGANELSVTFNDTLAAGNSSYFFGSDRDDNYTGGSGDDTLTGGGGNDTFAFTDGGGNDTVTDFIAGSGTDDVLDLTAFGFASFDDVINAAIQIGSHTLIRLDIDDSVALLGVSLGDLHASDVLI